MEIFDIIVISLILILGIKGLLTGLIKEVFGLIGIIGGIILASRNTNVVSTLITNYIYDFKNNSIENLVSFLLILLIFWFSFIVLGNIFSKLITLSGMQGINRFAGFIVGSAKIFLILAVVVAILSSIQFTNKKMEPFVKNSIMYHILVSTGEVIIKIDPTTLKSKIEQSLSISQKESLNLYKNTMMKGKEL